jgi:hypothetical protein
MEVRVVSGAVDMLPMLESAEFAETVRKSMVAAAQNDGEILVFWSSSTQAYPPCGFRIELISHGEVLDRGTMIDKAVSLGWKWKSPRTDGVLDAEELAVIRGMRVRVSGDPRASLEVLGAQWCWSGNVEMEIGEMMDRWKAERK